MECNAQLVGGRNWATDEWTESMAVYSIPKEGQKVFKEEKAEGYLPFLYPFWTVIAMIFPWGKLTVF